MLELESNPSRQKKVSILYVDDDELFSEIIASVFNPSGIELVQAKSGENALKQIEDPKTMEAFSVIIIERFLPDMDGMDVLKAIIERYNHQIPLVMLSSLDSEEDVVEGLRNGAVEYISKPVNLKIFVQKIESLINWKEELTT